MKNGRLYFFIKDDYQTYYQNSYNRQKDDIAPGIGEDAAPEQLQCP